ncbi:glycosyltransferase family 2 protein [Streptococcus pluranimalium]|uniref:Glycosyltransferase EpsH n=1 Tax=Streptococcus pluranimalium TaxID=82348 RepID=A0A345VMR1_9STRE|nr:glycosyltransferase family 2 protein [Streptococcus pluranimalium]AXJ14013.1 Putative glycosyltransferase EpsH [Streptococcus pluranimalium]
MEKISVIICVYNGEKHLAQAIESVLNQEYSHLEVILVNDGSKDGTGAICEQFKNQDKRVRVIHKPVNEGLGAGRNTGIAMATSDYIVFLDADDWIDSNHVSDLYDLMMRTDSDVAISNFTQYEESTGQYRLHINHQDYYEAVYSPQEWFAYQYGRAHNLSLCFTVPWSKMYKKSLFENILYPTDGFGEDDRTTWKTYLVADKIAYMHRSSLIYRINDSSMTQAADQATVFSTVPVMERLEVLGLLGFDLSSEISAFEWRGPLNRDSKLNHGDFKAYKDLKFRLDMMEKYRKKL